MKSFKRLSLLLALVLVVGSLPAISVRAQATCFGLADADCKILSTADANVVKETSFAQEFTFSLKANNNGQATEINATGTGSFAVDPAMMGKMNMSDPTAALAGLKLSLDVTGSTKGTGSDQSGKASLIIVNGVIYANANDGKGWMGAKLSDLTSQGTSMAAGNPAAAMATDPALLAALAKIPSIPGFIKLEKTTNSPELDGQKQIEFVYTLDIKSLVTSKDLYPIIKTIAGAAGGGSDLTDEQLAQFGQLAGTALGNTTIKITRWVGATDNLYHALAIDLNASIDPAVMGGSGPATTVALNLLVKLTKVGQPVDIKAPADAKMMTPPPSSGSGAAATMAATPVATAAK